MGQLQVLIVAHRDSGIGGIARYVDEQQRHVDGVSLDVYRTGPDTVGSVPELVAGVLASFWRMVLFPFRRRPDVVHVHSSYGHSFYRQAFYVLFAALVWRRPVVVHVHGSSFDEFVETASPALARFQSLVLGSAAAVIALSDYWREVLAERVPAENVLVLPNAVPTERYNPSFDRERQHVVFLSTLVDRKGVSEFAAAVNELAVRDDLPPYHVTVAGRGPLAGRVRSLADDHDHVSYAGFVDESEKCRLLDDATIYALPTHAEGMPIAILEAMAGGNAVVSTPVGSIPEVIGDDNGRLVPPCDERALADALAELLESLVLTGQMGRTNREKACDEFAWETTADRLESLYASLADDSERRPISSSPAEAL